MVFMEMISAGSHTLYIDPAATTILLSSISMIVLAIGASAIVLWRRAKKKVTKALNIDENANKEVEDKLVIHAKKKASDDADREGSQE